MNVSLSNSLPQALGLLLAGNLALGCTNAPEPSSTPSTPGNANDLPHVEPVPDPPITEPSLTCQPDVIVKPNSRALMITDPEVLARFPLKRVLQQIIDRFDPTITTPLLMMQQLFDTENSMATGIFPNLVHCDDPRNRAFRISPAAFCPRAEGKLATSVGFFEANHPDSFVPVAIVNRFDLTPGEGSNCGEHRIMYAKLSGQTNPNERVFLAFEGILDNPRAPNTLLGCRPVAELWASLENEPDINVVADKIEQLYFNGLSDFVPVVSPEHYSHSHRDQDDGGGGYGDRGGRPRRGQLRLSQGMQEPWEFREFHLHFTFNDEPEGATLFFGPVTTKNNPRTELFDPAVSLDDAVQLRNQFFGQLATLASNEGHQIQFSPAKPEWNAGSSVISSEPTFDLASRAFAGEPGQFFWQQIQTAMADQKIGADCPSADPLRPEHLVQRLSMLTCAGCHAPDQYLGSSRSLGCGQTWPNVEHRVHIDEFGKLSPALTESFLPRRADVMSLYLQGCDVNAIRANLEPAQQFLGGIPD